METEENEDIKLVIWGEDSIEVDPGGALQPGAFHFEPGEAVAKDE